MQHHGSVGPADSRDVAAKDSNVADHVGGYIFGSFVLAASLSIGQGVQDTIERGISPLATI